jgi:hypothetical protein
MVAVGFVMIDRVGKDELGVGVDGFIGIGGSPLGGTLRVLT